MATLIVNTIEEMNQAIAQGIPVVYRPNSLNSVVGYNTKSTVSGGGLGSTSSKTYAGIRGTVSDSSATYSKYLQNYTQDTISLDEQLEALTQVNPY